MSRISTWLLLVLLISSCAYGAVPHQSNGAKPAGGTDLIQVEEIWTVGGEDDEENIFGIITQVLIGEDGLIYLLDQQLSTVSVFTLSGELVRTIGREGDGPGEARNPNDMIFFPDGTLGLVQIFPGKIVKIHTDGTPAGNFPYASGDPTSGAGFSVLVRARIAGGTIILVGVDQTFSGGMLEQRYFLSSFGEDGGELTNFAVKQNQMNFAAMVLDEGEVDFPWARFDVSPEGKLVVAPARNDYTVQIYGTDGALESTFDREFETWQRNESDLARAQALLEAQGRNYPTTPEIRIEDTEPTINRLQVMPDGRIWVATNRGILDAAEGVMMQFDIFSPTGVFERQVDIRATADGLSDLLFLIDDEQAVLIRGFWQSIVPESGADDEAEEAEPISVTFCRLKS